MSASSRVVSAIVGVVEASRRRAVPIAALALAATLAGGVLVVRRIGIDTDTSNLISPDLPWRRAAAELDLAFPQNRDLVAVVVEGATPDQTGDAADALGARMASEPALFQDVRDPAGNPFFRRNGLLFLPRADVQKYADAMITAQPMLGALASDPSPR